jgi:hypothetical protein
MHPAVEASGATETEALDALADELERRVSGKKAVLDTDTDGRGIRP